MKGIYVLLINLDKNIKIKIGSLGFLNFKKGLYAYVGSAQNNLEKRVHRHLKKEKNLYWHIDYFLQKAKVVKIFYKKARKEEECKTAEKLKKNYEFIPKFGCSDCKCKSHLFSVNKKINKILNNWHAISDF